MLDKIQILIAEVAQLTAASADEAEQLRIKYLGKKGVVTLLFDDFKLVDYQHHAHIKAAVAV